MYVQLCIYKYYNPTAHCENVFRSLWCRIDTVETPAEPSRHETEAEGGGSVREGEGESGGEGREAEEAEDEPPPPEEVSVCVCLCVRACVRV